MKYFSLITIILLFLQSTLKAQSEKEQPNLVPNAGFELFASTPMGWFYRGEHFSQAMKYWTSPTATSPDAYGPRVRVPASWADKGFGKIKAHGGGAFAGITAYGCEKGKPHCREYIQIQLSEPLVPKQDYILEFFYANLPYSLQINNLGACFSKKKVNTQMEEPLVMTPAVSEKNIMNGSAGWKKFSKKFKAGEEAEFMLLGNFFTDSQTMTEKARLNDTLNYAYYYIDDVLLKKVPPILPIPVPDDDLTRIKVEPGKVVQLKNIYFETDGSDLEPRSFFELKKLLLLMRRNPTMKIEVRGHTDNQGTDEYNLKLSADRAKSVVNFLVYNGIKPYRVKSKGFGETMMIAENETEEGRQMNRRVEFIILSK